MRTATTQFLVLILLVAVGCRTSRISSKQWRSVQLEKYPPPASERSLQSGDRVKIYLQTPEPEVCDRVVDERGNVSLPFTRPNKGHAVVFATGHAPAHMSFLGTGTRDKPEIIQVWMVPESVIEGRVVDQSDVVGDLRNRLEADVIEQGRVVPAYRILTNEGDRERR